MTERNRAQKTLKILTCTLPPPHFPVKMNEMKKGKVLAVKLQPYG